MTSAMSSAAKLSPQFAALGEDRVSRVSATAAEIEPGGRSGASAWGDGLWLRWCSSATPLRLADSIACRSPRRSSSCSRARCWAPGSSMCSQPVRVPSPSGRLQRRAGRRQASFARRPDRPRRFRRRGASGEGRRPRRARPVLAGTHRRVPGADRRRHVRGARADRRRVPELRPTRRQAAAREPVGRSGEPVGVDRRRR